MEERKKRRVRVLVGKRQNYLLSVVKILCPIGVKVLMINGVAGGRDRVVGA